MRLFIAVYFGGVVKKPLPFLCSAKIHSLLTCFGEKTIDLKAALYLIFRTITVLNIDGRLHVRCLTISLLRKGEQWCSAFLLSYKR